MFSKRKYLKLLSCHLINKKIKLYKKPKMENDIRFRFEYEGSYLKEYWMNFEDAVLTLKLNKGNCIYNKKGDCMVYSLKGMIYCIVSL